MLVRSMHALLPKRLVRLSRSKFLLYRCIDSLLCSVCSPRHPFDFADINKLKSRPPLMDSENTASSLLSRFERYSARDIDQNDFIELSPRTQTHDVSNSAGYLYNVSHLTDGLLTAARKAWPSRHRSQYKAVRVLLLYWTEDDLGVRQEVQELDATFRELYHYETESWMIPSQKPDRQLKKKIAQFTEDFEDIDTLLVVYYAGHARPNAMPNECPEWVS